MSRLFHPLFRVRILQDAELDIGWDEFDSLSDELQKARLDAYDIRRFLQIVPTQETNDFLRQHRLKIVPDKLGFYVIGEVKVSDIDQQKTKAIFPIPPAGKMAFVISLRDSLFPFSSNLPLDLNQGEMFYASNRFETEEEGQFHLTQPISEFDPTASYRAGDLVVDDETNPTGVFEAVSTVAAAATISEDEWISLPAPLYDNGVDYEIGARILENGILYEATAQGTHPAPPSANWKKIYEPHLRIGVTKADFVSKVGNAFSFPIVGSHSFLHLKVFDLTDSLVLEKSYFHETGENLSEIFVDLRSLKYERYRFELTDPDGLRIQNFPREAMIVSSELDYAFGMMEVHVSAGTHSLLDGDDQLLSPEFHIRFRKRHSFWRYIVAGDLSGLPPADLGEFAQEDPADASRYLTKRPYPLTSGSVTLTKFAQSTSLPNPDPYRVKLEDQKVFSETHIYR